MKNVLRKMRSFFRHPHVIVLPVIACLVYGWYFYLDVQATNNVNSSDHNLLAGGDFENLDDSGLPRGWQLKSYGGSNYISDKSTGYIGGQSMRLDIYNYQDGNVDLLTPNVTIGAKSNFNKYLFKGYYKSNCSFSLILKYYYHDKTTLTKIVKSYPASGSDWTTASYGFTNQDNNKNIDSVQFIYRLASSCVIKLDGIYLEKIDEKKKDIYIDPSVTLTKNLIPNSSFRPRDNNKPEPWTSYSTGGNKANFSYSPNLPEEGLQIKISDYKEGEAKWQYPEQNVTPKQRFYFQLQYKSTVSFPVVAEYLKDDDTRQFVAIGHLPPSSDWTEFSAIYETPLNAKTMYISSPLQSNGQLVTRDYFLQDITKPNVKNFKRPLVTVSLDDGLESAYSMGAPLLEEFGIPGTFYINPITQTNNGFMTIGQMGDLVKRGHEVASHSYQHYDLTAINRGNIKNQMQQSISFFTDNIHFTPTDFATPYGRSDPEVEWYARKYFRSLRGTNTGINTSQNINPYNLLTFYVDQQTSLKTIQSVIDDTKNSDGWLILIYHGFSTNLDQQSRIITTSNFRDQLRLISDSNVTPVTTREALREIFGNQ